MNTSIRTAIALIVGFAVAGALVWKLSNGEACCSQPPADPAPQTNSLNNTNAPEPPANVPIDLPAPRVHIPKSLPTLLELGSHKCIPCKAMTPILDSLRNDFADQLNIRFHDILEDPAIAREHNVRVMPTQVFLDPEGKELFRHEGFFSRDDIVAAWQRLGYELETPE